MYMLLSPKSARASGGRSPPSFEEVLSTQPAINYFIEFLKRDHSAENVFFWLEVEKFRQLTEKDALISQARHIYSGYVCDGAVHEINIDGDDKQFMKHAIEMAGDQIDNQLFDNAQKHIFLMMKEGSYPRFLRSAECRQLLESPPEPQPAKKGC